MWTETSEIENSVLGNNTLRIPAVAFEDGTMIIRGGRLPGGAQVLKYKTGSLTINIEMTNKADSRAPDTFTVFLDAALLKANASRFFEGSSFKRKLIEDLTEVILGWHVLLDEQDLPVKSVVFV